MGVSFVNDQINFQLRADKTVTSDTVKVIVTINALVEGETTETVLRQDIKAGLAKFIAAEWQINVIERTSDESGYEKALLRATARVSERENYNLENRAKDVSRKGLQFGQVKVDTSIPAPLLEAAEKELRLKLLMEAYEEAAELSKAAKRDYRVQAINYQNVGDPYARKSAATAMVASTSYGSGFRGGSLESVGGDDDDGESLANAQKISLAASIVLGIAVPVTE